MPYELFVKTQFAGDLLQQQRPRKKLLPVLAMLGPWIVVIDM